MAIKKTSLKRYLERLYRTYDIGFLSSDPLEFVHRYADPADREVVGLIASSLAYGRVAGIRRSVERVLSVMGASPVRFAAAFRPAQGPGPFKDFAHRFNRGEDIACLVYFIRQMLEKSGSIGAFFMDGYSAGDKNIKGALGSFAANVLALDAGRIYGARSLPRGAGVRYFFPSPENGSACKRLNLYLRWMVRRSDGLDFGLWREVEPRKLVIPLDTHIARISRHIGLTKRRTPDWKTAEEITASLSELDPADPVKYDFALSRLGILDRCPAAAEPEKCRDCVIRKVCVL